MAHIEAYLRMAHDGGLTMLTIFEHGRLLDTIFFAQSLAQQQIGCCTGFAPQFVFELQALLPALLTQQWQRSLPVKVFYIVIQVYHLFAFWAN
jgi:hypothetical protein